jgi:hypothetical protein
VYGDVADPDSLRSALTAAYYRCIRSRPDDFERCAAEAATAFGLVWSALLDQVDRDHQLLAAAG